ncbi:MAG TPA: M23 family metallopeptidase [Candidatus Limnocylindria bacterium]
MTTRSRALVRLIALASAIALACAPVAQASVPTSVAPRASVPTDAPTPTETAVASQRAGDPLRCTERVTIPQLADVFEAQWSPNAKLLALSHIVRIPSDETITGWEEDQRLAIYDTTTGAVTERGVGSEPEWSGSGTYLSYWTDQTTLWIVRPGTVLPVAVLQPTEPNIMWVGDEMLFWSGAEIRAWKGGQVTTVARSALTPKYPHDDVYFSGDGARFSVTRYASDGSTARYIGNTSTGEIAPLDDHGATFIEWAPRGQTLLMRSAGTLTLWDAATGRQLASAATASGTVHLWTSDGGLALGKMSPTVPAGNAYDTFSVIGSGAVATVPNLLGIRSFSPDGSHFVGVSRTGLYSTQLELYRCGAPDGEATDLASDPAVQGRAAKVAADAHRFVRPGAAAITQFIQGIHTGIDVAATYGTILVAADDGVVDAVGWVPVGGRRVCVLHESGVESCDYHTALPLVGIGEHVVRGQPVALMGLTGETTGPHVHWEAKRDGAIVDPLDQ